MERTKHLEKHSNKIAESKKEKVLFENSKKSCGGRKSRNFRIYNQKGENKDRLADEKIIKQVLPKISLLTAIIHIKFNWVRVCSKLCISSNFKAIYASI